MIYRPCTIHSHGISGTICSKTNGHCSTPIACKRDSSISRLQIQTSLIYRASVGSGIRIPGRTFESISSFPLSSPSTCTLHGQPPAGHGLHWHTPLTHSPWVIAQSWPHAAVHARGRRWFWKPVRSRVNYSALPTREISKQRKPWGIEDAFTLNFCCRRTGKQYHFWENEV